MVLLLVQFFLLACTIACTAVLLVQFFLHSYSTPVFQKLTLTPELDTPCIMF